MYIAFIIVISMVILIGIAERFVIKSWQPCYFKIGIPIYKKYLLLVPELKLNAEDLRNQYEHLNLNKILFNQIDNNQIAFQESQLNNTFIASPSVMHGLIQYKEGKLQLIGLINWLVLAFILMFIAMGIVSSIIGEFDFMYVVFPIGIFAILYYKQSKQYSKIFDILQAYSIKNQGITGDTQ